MNKPEIEKGIKSLCETSAQIKGFYDQHTPANQGNTLF